MYFESTFVDPDSALSFFSYAQIFLEMIPLLMSNNFYVEVQGFENIFTFKKSDTALFGLRLFVFNKKSVWGTLYLQLQKQVFKNFYLRLMRSKTIG